MRRSRLAANEQNLIFRYLLWCYKTTKEDIEQKIADFQAYMDTKEKNALGKKYLNLKKKTLQPDYWYLQNRLAAIEQVIIEFLGRKELKSIQVAYEKEMTRRILEAREQHA